VVAWSAACAAAASSAAGTPAHHPSSAPSTRSPSTSTPCPPTTGALSSPPGAGQIVAVLAQMALAHA
jgi:hypothetical protein